MNRRTLMRSGIAVMSLAAISGAAPAVAQTEIVVWVAGEPGQPVVYEQLAQEYNASHTETNFVIVKNSSDLFNPALVPALSAGEGPELFMFGTGPGQPAALIDAGLVADLTPFYRELGWDRMIPPSVVDITSSEGKLWAVGNEVETTVMFYNRAIFEKLGLAVPTTWAEFQATISALKSGGYETPIGLGGADRWPTSHWQSMLWGRYAGPEGLADVMFGDAKWNAEPFVAATARFQQMADDGYFGPHPVADGYAEVMEKFWAGGIPMTFTGAWVVPAYIALPEDRKSEFGVFQVPPLEDGQLIYPTEGIGSGWYIRANSPNKEAIARFIDFMMFTPEARATLITEGTTPVGPLKEALAMATLPQISVDIGSTIDRDRANGTIYAFLDTVTPSSMTDASYDGLQALLLGQMTPQQFADEIEAAWAEAKAEGTILKAGGVD